jgi:hypothetical protein
MVLQVAQYEAIDFEYAAAHPTTCLINSYVIRKALIRKHYLSATVDNWVAKHPDSVLGTHVKRSEHFEVDYAEFLDDALVEAWDLRESMERSEGKERAEEKDWWILKPGMSDRGQGIRLFSSLEELQAIFDGWDAELSSDEDEEDEGGNDDEEMEGEEGEEGDEGRRPTQDGHATDDGKEHHSGDGITTSHLRHFVAQPYIHPPLLLADGRKFHLRTYVLCIGSLKVYVYRAMLALFAGTTYAPPWETADLAAHLTNTCLQGDAAAQDDGSGTGTGTGSSSSVRRFWDLDGLEPTLKQSIFNQICDITGDVFEAAARGMPVHFQPLPNAFEVFGLDFLVDAAGTAWLLEVNAFPDFKQTGGELQSLVAVFWKEALRLAVGTFFGACAGKGDEEEEEEEELSQGSAVATGEEDAHEPAMVLVRYVELGRR